MSTLRQPTQVDSSTAPQPVADGMTMLESTDLHSLRIAIDARLGRALREHLAADDILQETLLHAWRDRAAFVGSHPRGFRSWLLAIAENRIRRAAEAARTRKRRGVTRIDDVERTAPAVPQLASLWPTRATPWPCESAEQSEWFRTMSLALAALPPQLREVVRLRVFEQCNTEETASRLGIGVSAVQHRLRKGVTLYRARVVRSLP